MVSKKTTQALILCAAVLGAVASWQALPFQATNENVRPGVTPSMDRSTVDRRSTDDAEGSGSAGDTAGSAHGTSHAAAGNSARATTTSAAATKPMVNSNLVEAYTEPYRDIAIAASEMGTLSSVNVKEGDVVKSGDVIALMADEVLKASLEVARRSMNVEGTLQSAAADVNLRRTELTKLRELRERDHASQQEVDRVLTELTVAESRHLSVREELEIKQLEFRRIEAQLEQRSIRVPIAGIVSEVHKDAGEFVSPSDPVVARVVQLDPLLIVFSVPLDHRTAFQQDQSVTLQLGFANATAQGIVEYVSPTTDSSNSSIRVKVRLPNPNGEFQSGERAVLKCETSTSPGSLNKETSSPVADRNHEISSRQ
jgi:RND family efflux transporter MFP subunit